MLKEYFCKRCKKYYFFDDGLDKGLLAPPTDPSKSKRQAECPVCIDPNRVPGETYSKGTILTALGYHLFKQELGNYKRAVLRDLIKDYPRAYNLYISNGTYKTITLYTGLKFKGSYGDFEIGPVVKRKIRGRIVNNRKIRCCRCKNITEVTKMRLLAYYVGFLEKRCGFCNDFFQRNTSGLKVGSEKRNDSLRALAKALNVSVSDFRRHSFDKAIPALSTGTVVNGLKIIEVFWDEDPKSYAPKYRLHCAKCGQVFECIQKHVYQLSHFCKGE